MSAHRIQIEDGVAEVVVRAGEHVVARSARPKLLHEGELPVRRYLPAEDVEPGVVLTRTDKSTHCPFKGDATYWTVAVNGHTIENAAWSYEEPIPQAAAIAGHVCFDLAPELTVE
jgi:uncharacterized protein (DUF427 family)